MSQTKNALTIQCPSCEGAGYVYHNPYGLADSHPCEGCGGDRTVTLTQVGLLFGGVGFIAQEVVEKHMPFAAPPEVSVQAVYVINGGDS